MIPTMTLQGVARIESQYEKDDDLHTNHVLVHQGQIIVKPDNPGESETTKNDFVRLRIMHDVDNGRGQICGLSHVWAWMQTS